MNISPSLVAPQGCHNLVSAAHQINDSFGKAHSVAVVLGSGYDEWLKTLEGVQSVPMSTIKGLPVPKNTGHDRSLHSVRLGGVETGVEALIFGGRVHAYEGHGFEDLTFAVRAAILAGAKSVLLTNAAGGVNAAPGSLIFHNDFHLDTPVPFFQESPQGLYYAKHIDPAQAYDEDLIDAAIRHCLEAGLIDDQRVRVDKGRYLMWRGPWYETANYVKGMIQNWGIDLFGMSTVPSTHAAHALGAQVLAVSLVSNWAKGQNPDDVSSIITHDEVKDELQKNRERLDIFMNAVVPLLARSPERRTNEKGEPLPPVSFREWG